MNTKYSTLLGLIEEEIRKIRAYNDNPSLHRQEEVQWESNLTPDAGSFEIKVCRGTFSEVLASYTKDEVVATIGLTYVT